MKRGRMRRLSRRSVARSYERSELGLTGDALGAPIQSSVRYQREPFQFLLRASPPILEAVQRSTGNDGCLRRRESLGPRTCPGFSILPVILDSVMSCSRRPVGDCLVDAE